MDEKIPQPLKFCGATANIVYVNSKTGKAYCVNLGDSKAMYSRHQGKDQ